MHRLRIFLVAAMAGTLLMLATSAQAASGYANPAFKAQWEQGEAITPNFWGPLSTAKDGQQESYKESGGQRLVQYFDKGRMELTNGSVTNGLLATEIIKGQIQTGDATFQPQTPPSIPIAGDPENAGPTYAGLASRAASLLQSTSSTPGALVLTVVGATGAVSTTDAAVPDPAVMIGGFDDATGHNVARAFVDYRGKAGLATIGFAITEPFRTNVKVGGVSKDVMVQIFERRALTYTASNPDAFKVEMGNIGQHYFNWRYPGGAPPSSGGGGRMIELKGAIAFAVPDTWKRDPTPVTAGPSRVTYLGPAPTLQLVMQVGEQPAATLDSEIAGFIAAVRNKLAGGTLSDERGPDNVKIGGEPAKAYLAFGTRKDNTPFSSIVVVVFHKGKEYTFIALADANPMPYYDDINKILATVTFQD